MCWAIASSFYRNIHHKKHSCSYIIRPCPEYAGIPVITICYGESPEIFHKNVPKKLVQLVLTLSYSPYTANKKAVSRSYLYQNGSFKFVFPNARLAQHQIRLLRNTDSYGIPVRETNHSHQFTCIHVFHVISLWNN